MDSVRSGRAAPRRVLNQFRAHPGRPAGGLSATGVLRMESMVFDLVFVIGVIALFAAFGLLGRAVDRL